MSHIDLILAKDVVTIEDLIQYTRDRFGVVVHFMDKNRFKGLWKEFQEDNPHVDIQILVKAVNWAKVNRFRITSLTGVLLAVAAAHERGGLPELNPHFHEAKSFEQEIEEALALEPELEWRRRLYGSSGKALVKALSDWKAQRLPLLSGAPDGTR